MKNKLNKLMLGAAIATSFTASSFAQNATNTATSTATTTPVVIASTTASTTAMLNCMINAVDKRENSIILAQDAQNVAIKNALTIRKDSLKAAWGISDNSQRNTARAAAWTAYNASAKTANTNLKNAKKAAQDLFKTEAKACGLINKKEPVRKDFKSNSSWKNFKSLWLKNLEDYDDKHINKNDDGEDRDNR